MSNKKLQILVPQYKETDDIIKPLLDSIAIQQNVRMDEIGVIIVNDGTDVHLTDDFLKSYPYDIEYYLNEHKGVSATRNACLDHATANFVMFCDADDMFYNACGLYIVFREMDNGGFDSLVSAFIEETFSVTFVLVSNNEIWPSSSVLVIFISFSTAFFFSNLFRSGFCCFESRANSMDEGS